MHLFDVVLKPFSICEWFVTKFTLVISHFFMHYLKTRFFLFNDFKTLKEMHLQLHSWLSCSWRTLTCLLFTCTSLKMIVKIGLFCKGFITQFTFEPLFFYHPLIGQQRKSLMTCFTLKKSVDNCYTFMHAQVWHDFLEFLWMQMLCHKFHINKFHEQMSGKFGDFFVTSKWIVERV